MCGIAGIVEVGGRAVDRDLLTAMTTVQAHRGPDGDGFVCRGGVGFGHRRLAIIDLVTGDQPMPNDDRTIWIVFNGEIYNYRELRDELEARGVRFRTQSDTEVILRAYEVYGTECVKRLRGMFAFAVLDERSRQVFLARDRVGIKPLVYSLGWAPAPVRVRAQGHPAGGRRAPGPGSRGPRRVPRVSLRRGAPDDLSRGAQATTRLDAHAVPGRWSAPRGSLLDAALLAAAPGRPRTSGSRDSRGSWRRRSRAT